MVEERSDILEGQPCPVCNKNTLTLREMSREVHFFGLCYIFSMDCSECDYHMADVETDNNNEPVKVSLDVESEEDLNIKIVKSRSGSEITNILFLYKIILFIISLAFRYDINSNKLNS